MSQIETKKETEKLHYIVAYYIERWGYDTTNVFVSKIEDIPSEIESSFIRNPNKPKPEIIILGVMLSCIYTPSAFTNENLEKALDKVRPNWHKELQ